MPLPPTSQVRHKAPRKRKPLTDKQREALVRRMAVARAAKAAKVHSGED